MVLRNDCLRDKILQFYNDILFEECGIDYNDAVELYDKIGNVPGVYPDTLLLLIKMIKHFKLKSIVEFGCGMSTLFFTKIARDLKISFTSFEEDKKYRKITLELLYSYGLGDTTIFTQHIGKKNIENDLKYKDLIFIDCSAPLREELVRLLRYIPLRKFVVIDDINMFPKLSFILDNIYCEDYNFYVYNGSGRLDRQQYISYNRGINFDEFLLQEMNYL